MTNHKALVSAIAVKMELARPYCVMIDFKSLDDNAVTVRDRDTMEQERVGIGEIKKYLEEKLR